MSDHIIHALVMMQNWGEGGDLLKMLIHNKHVISLFHVMGRHSYLMDTNFDNKEQLSRWIDHMKSAKLPSGLPSIQSIQTQRIIDVRKQKEDFSLRDYSTMKEKYHFFMKIDNPHHDEELLSLLHRSSIVMSVLHVQGENSFTVEIMTSNYNGYRDLLSAMKTLDTIHHIETQEVISVLKYRNQIMDDKNNLKLPDEDIRELYSL